MPADLGPPRRGGRRGPRRPPAAAGAVALAAVIGLAACSGGPARPGRAGHATPAAPAASGGPDASGTFAPLPPPHPGLSADQLQALLPGPGQLPRPYQPQGAPQSLAGFSAATAPPRLSCKDIQEFFGQLSFYDTGYSSDANESAVDGNLDSIDIEILEATSVPLAEQDLAALQAGARGCPVLDTGVTGVYHVAVSSVPGLGDQNVNLSLTQDSISRQEINGPYGPKDILLIRDGGYLVDVDYQLESPPGKAHNPGQPLSVLPPAAALAHSVLARL